LGERGSFDHEQEHEHDYQPPQSYGLAGETEK
jgi:hypothetical protein